MHGRSLPFFLSFGTSVTFSLVQRAGFFPRPIPKALRRNIRIPGSRRHPATGLGRSLTSVMHTKRAAPTQFRLLLPIDLVYRFSYVDTQRDLMLLWLLPKLIVTLSRDVGLRPGTDGRPVCRTINFLN